MEMNIWKQQMHEAIGAFLGGIPATSRFSMNFESDILEIRVHYELAPTENALRKRKKKVPPSKIKRNRQRLVKFLEKPEAQPDLPPITSCERSSEGEEIPAPPLIPPLETCTEEGLEFDTSADEDPHSYLQAKLSVTCKDSEHSGQGEGEKEKGKGEQLEQGDEEKGRGEIIEQTNLELWRMLTEIRSKMANMATKEDFEPIINNMNEFISMLLLNLFPL